MRCEACRGTGASAFGRTRTTDFPEALPCEKCRGLGIFSLCSFALRIGVTPNEIYRVRDMRPTRVVGVRVLEAIEKYFPEALAS